MPPLDNLLPFAFLVSQANPLVPTIATIIMNLSLSLIMYVYLFCLSD